MTPVVRLRVYSAAGALDKELQFTAQSLADAAADAVLAAVSMQRAFHVIERAGAGSKALLWSGRANDNERLPAGDQRRAFVLAVVRKKIESAPRVTCAACEGATVDASGGSCYACGGRGDVVNL